MKLVFDGDYGPTRETFDFSPNPFSGVAFDNEDPDLTAQFNARVEAQGAWRAAQWNGDTNIRALGLAEDQLLRAREAK